MESGSEKSLGTSDALTDGGSEVIMDSGPTPIELLCLGMASFRTVVLLVLGMPDKWAAEGPGLG